MRTYSGDPGSFEILRNGKQIYWQEGWKFYIGTLTEDDNPAIGKDITGDGKPNLVVSEWTGGAHDAFISSVFEIGEEFRKIGTIDGQHSTPIFEDLDGDGKLEIVIRDWAFAYWWFCFADSPAPKVVLSYIAGFYKVAIELMREPAPATKELREHIDKLKGQTKWVFWGDQNMPSAQVGSYMLDLIYSGNAESARKFLDMGWPADAPGKEEFLRDFRKTLENSPYWPEIKAMNAN